jgi:hypothetical protein
MLPIVAPAPKAVINMTSDPTPPKSSWLDELNLPKLLAGPAGEAISRLIGGAADIPAAWLQRFTQGIRDNTEAKSVVSKAVAEAAADAVKKDPALIERATHSLLARGLRRQVTREAIARKTLLLLQEDGAPSGSTVNAVPRRKDDDRLTFRMDADWRNAFESEVPPPTARPELHRVDEDWLNTFARYAEEASSDRLQDLWARVLAGQLRRPQAFSLQTLRFVAELDQEIATTFERWAPAVLFGEFIPFPPTASPQIDDIIRLEECGLVSSPLSNLAKTFNFEPGLHRFPYKTHSLLIHLEAAQSVTFPAAFLTKVGREIYSIIHPADNIEHARHFATSLMKDHVLNIFYATNAVAQQGPVNSSDPSIISLWHKPA